MIRVKDTLTSLEHVRCVFQNNKRAFYSRFGDGDVYIMMGRNQANHDASPLLTKEMKEAFAIDDPLYMKGLAINHPREHGMVRGFKLVKKQDMKNLLYAILFVASLTSCEDNLEFQRTDSLMTPKSRATSGQLNPSVLAVSPPHPYYYFYKGGSSNNLRYTYSDNGVNWTGDVVLSNNSGSKAGPSAIYWNSKFYVAYRGGSTYNVYVSSSPDGINWTQVTLSSSIKSDFCPALRVSGGELVLYYNNLFDNYVYSISAGPLGLFTAPPVQVSNRLCYSDIYADPYYIYYLTGQNRIIQDNGAPVFPNAPPKGTIIVSYQCPDPFEPPVYHGSDVIVGSTILNGTYYIVIKGTSTDKIMVLKEEGCGWSAVVLDAKTSSRPSVITLNNKMTIVYKGRSTNTIYYAESVDGVNWSVNNVAYGGSSSGPYLMQYY